MKDVGGDKSTMKITKWKLNQLSQVKAFACIVNSEEQMRLMENQMQMAESCAHIKALTKKAKDSKQKDLREKILAAVPKSKTKLATKHGGVKALTKVQLCALLFSEYQTLDKDSRPKIAVVELLKAKIAENPRSFAVAPPATATVTA